MMRLVRLGVRLSVGAGRSGRLRLVLMASGSAVAAFVVLTALALSGLAEQQDAREQRIAPALNARVTPEGTLVGTVIEDGWNGRELRRVVLAEARPGAPVPPGVERLPRANEVLVSPALLDLIRTEPLVSQRFPQSVSGTIGTDGLVEPGQLIAYVGVSDASEIWRPAAIEAWGDASTTGHLDPRAARTIGLLVLLTLVAPVVMFMATCARLSATARTQRLAALRLIGLSPWRTQLVSSIELLIVGAGGSLLGLAAWLTWRHLDPTVHVGTFSWYSSDLWPGPATMAIALVALVALTTVVGLVGGHAGIKRPLEVRRERSVRSMSWWRAAPLAGGIALLTWSWHTSGQQGQFVSWMAPFALGMMATAVGLVLAVPFGALVFGRALGRSYRPAAMLAGARLRHEPAVGGRVVAAMAIAIFAAGFAQVVLTSVDVAFAGTDENQVGSVFDLTAYGTTTDASRYAAISDLGVALPKLRLGPDQVDAVAATCAQMRAATTGAITGCRDDRPLFVRSIQIGDSPSPVGTQADVDRALTSAGLPKSAGSVDLTFPAGNGSFYAAVIIPPDLAPPTTDFTVAFPGSSYDPQAVVAGLAAVDPGAVWDSGITGVDRLDSARIYTGIVVVGTASALGVALLAIVIATLDRTIERAGPQARLAAIGTSASTLRAATALQVLPVSAAVLVASGATAVLGGSSYLRWGDPGSNVPLGPIAALTALGVAAALLATFVAVVGTVTRPHPQLLRTE